VTLLGSLLAAVRPLFRTQRDLAIENLAVAYQNQIDHESRRIPVVISEDPAKP
jgi:hypothetical protein